MKINQVIVVPASLVLNGNIQNIGDGAFAKCDIAKGELVERGVARQMPIDGWRKKFSKSCFGTSRDAKTKSVLIRTLIKTIFFCSTFHRNPDKIPAKFVLGNKWEMVFTWSNDRTKLKNENSLKTCFELWRLKIIAKYNFARENCFKIYTNIILIFGNTFRNSKNYFNIYIFWICANRFVFDRFLFFHVL